MRESKEAITQSISIWGTPGYRINQFQMGKGTWLRIRTNSTGKQLMIIHQVTFRSKEFQCHFTQHTKNTGDNWKGHLFLVFVFRPFARTQGDKMGGISLPSESSVWERQCRTPTTSCTAPHAHEGQFSLFRGSEEVPGGVGSWPVLSVLCSWYYRFTNLVIEFWRHK